MMELLGLGLVLEMLYLRAVVEQLPGTDLCGSQEDKEQIN
jgi:hypothetical protein